MVTKTLTLNKRNIKKIEIEYKEGVPEKNILGDWQIRIMGNEEYNDIDNKIIIVPFFIEKLLNDFILGDKNKLEASIQIILNVK